MCIYTRAKALTRYAVESFCSAEATLVRLRVYASQKGSSRLKKYMRKKFRTVIVYSGEVLYTVREEYTLFWSKRVLHSKNFAAQFFSMKYLQKLGGDLQPLKFFIKAL